MAEDLDLKKNTGYILAYRSIQSHWIWDDKPFSKGQAWVDLLLSVNHTDKSILFNGNVIEVKRGSRITSIRQLCDRWGWSNTKVRQFLKCLQDDQMLHYKSDTKKTVITIENYGLYQDGKKQKTSQKRQQNTAETQQKHTNKELIKNEKIYSLEFEDFYSLYPNPIEKQRTFTNWNKAIQSSTAEELIQAAKNYKNGLKTTDKQYIKTSANFLGKDKIYLDYITKDAPKLIRREIIIEEIDR